MHHSIEDRSLFPALVSKHTELNLECHKTRPTFSHFPSGLTSDHRKMDEYDAQIKAYLSKAIKEGKGENISHLLSDVNAFHKLLIGHLNK